MHEDHRINSPETRLKTTTLGGIGLATLLCCAAASRGASPQNAAAPVSERAACSTLVQSKHPADEAFKTIAALGYRWIDLSCLNWAPHVSVPSLLKDFDAEAQRVETLLATNQLRVANLTFDAVDLRRFDRYEAAFSALAKLAARLHARVINLMAAPVAVDRDDYVARLRALELIAVHHHVLLTLETHCSQITEQPAQALWLCQQVPGLGLTLDPSHYYAGPNQGTPFDELLPFVQGTGFRAGAMSWKEIQLPWGEGPIDFAALVRKLEASGYRGFYVCEYIEGFNKLDAVAEAKKFIAWARALDVKSSVLPRVGEITVPQGVTARQWR